MNFHSRHVITMVITMSPQTYSVMNAEMIGIYWSTGHRQDSIVCKITLQHRHEVMMLADVEFI